MTSAWAVAPYHSGLGAAVRRAKGSPDRALAAELARTLARHVGREPELWALLLSSDVVTWAPSPWTRRLGRGFSLGALLAGALPPVRPVTPLLTIRPGPRQAALGRHARRAGLGHRLRALKPVSGRCLLIDDVLTTGATLEACACELLASGADEVHALVLCHAEAQDDPASSWMRLNPGTSPSRHVPQ